jgi:hypothetical protein
VPSVDDRPGRYVAYDGNSLSNADLLEGHAKAVAVTVVTDKGIGLLENPKANQLTLDA